MNEDLIQAEIIIFTFIFEGIYVIYIIFTQSAISFLIWYVCTSIYAARYCIHSPFLTANQFFQCDNRYRTYSSEILDTHKS